MVEAQVELQRELFERQDKRDRNAEAASARLQSAQAMPREQVIHQHITNPERPAQDIDTLLASHLESTEQRMLRHMHNQFGQSGALISHLAGRVDNIAAAAHAIANKPPPEVVVQGATGPAGPPGPPGAGAVTSTINNMTKVTNKTMVLKLKSKKHAGLTVSASSNPPPPPGAPGASALLNPVVEAPAQLQAPNIAVPLSVPIINYPTPPPQQFVSNIEGKLEARLAQVKGKPTVGPQHVAKANSLALDARAKRKQQSEDLAARRRNLAADPISNLDKKQQERRAAVKSKPTKGPQHQEKNKAIASATRMRQIRENEASYSPDDPPMKKAKTEPPKAAPKRSGRAGGASGRSSGRAPKQFAVTPVA